MRAETQCVSRQMALGRTARLPPHSQQDVPLRTDIAGACNCVEVERLDRLFACSQSSR
jgi:hypothetical protein